MVSSPWRRPRPSRSAAMRHSATSSTDWRTAITTMRTISGTCSWNSGLPPPSRASRWSSTRAPTPPTSSARTIPTYFDDVEQFFTLQRQAVAAMAEEAP